MPGARAVATVLAVAGLSACGGRSSVDADPPPPSPAPVSELPPPPTAVTGPVPPLPEVGDVPVEHDPGYADAVNAFGVDQVTAAVTADARIAQIALADCHRWTTGEVDPRLRSLLAPSLLTRVQEELDESKVYGGFPLPSLLSHLPTNDGNGNNEAADARGGCDGSEPLRYGPWPLTLQVDGSGAAPQLVLTGGFVTHVTLGDTRVQAAQDWVFTSQQIDQGWQLVDAAAAGKVDWAPQLPQ